MVSLRLYTTSAFQQINNPLRDQERISRGEAHPLPVTVMLIVSGPRHQEAVCSGRDLQRRHTRARVVEGHEERQADRLLCPEGLHRGDTQQAELCVCLCAWLKCMLLSGLYGVCVRVHAFTYLSSTRLGI